MAGYEAKFFELGRYAPRIYDNPKRKLKKFIDGLRPSIRRVVATHDPETFAKALRVAHIAERENDRFIEDQKRVGKRPTPPPFNRPAFKKQKRPEPTAPVAAASPSTLPICAHCGRPHPGRLCWKMTGKCFN